MKVQETRSNKVLKQSKEFKRFIRYLLVGLSGTLLDFAVLTLLKQFFNIPTAPANVTSYSLGIINNYLLSSYWVYPEARQGQHSRQFIKFGLVSVIGLLMNNLIVLGLEEPAGNLLHNAAYGYLPAKIFATGCGLLWNFFANRYWTFGAVN